MKWEQSSSKLLLHVGKKDVNRSCDTQSCLPAPAYALEGVKLRSLVKMCPVNTKWEHTHGISLTAAFCWMRGLGCCCLCCPEVAVWSLSFHGGTEQSSELRAVSYRWSSQAFKLSPTLEVRLESRGVV